MLPSETRGDSERLPGVGQRRFLLAAWTTALAFVVFVWGFAPTAQGERDGSGAFGFRFEMPLTEALQRLESQSTSYDRKDRDGGRVEVTISSVPVELPGTPRETFLSFFEEKLYAISISWTDHPRRTYNEMLDLLRSKYGRPVEFNAYAARWMIRDDVVILLQIVDEKATYLDYIFLPLATTAGKARDL
ncbi:MAG: hypothetical protein ACE5I9_09245 [Candidatus Methylomirabilales bacterium]